MSVLALAKRKLAENHINGDGSVEEVENPYASRLRAVFYCPEKSEMALASLVPNARPDCAHWEYCSRTSSRAAKTLRAEWGG
ncbi:hypothetical protein ACNUI4_32365 [Pseudomonas aeruginosa]